MREAAERFVDVQAVAHDGDIAVAHRADHLLVNGAVLGREIDEQRSETFVLVKPIKGASDLNEQPLGHGLVVNRLTKHVPNAAERIRTDGHLDRCAGIDSFDAAGDAVRGRHSYRADEVAGKVRLHLQHGIDLADRRVRMDRQGVVDSRHLIRRELNVNNSADDADDASDCALTGRCGVRCFSHLLLQCSCATDDLGDLRRDGTLTCTIIDSC